MCIYMYIYIERETEREMNRQRLQPCKLKSKEVPPLTIGNGKRGHYRRGLFAGGFSKMSTISKFA